jgi:23S rRNA pseudouridine1911/1915/1917 synthase
VKSERTGQGRIAHHVTNEDLSVAECLRKHFRLDEARIDELLSLGAIYSNKRRIFENRKLAKGAYLRIHLEPKRFPVESIDWKSRIVATHRDFLVVNKPPGIPVHASLDNVRDNVLQQLRDATGQYLLVTQRLDVPVGGLMVLARNPDFQRRFNTWLAERKVIKIYRALVEQAPAVGLHVHYMEPSERSPKRVTLEERPGWARCELTVRSMREIPGHGIEVEIELHTGRTHQIRAQLGALGSPVKGDRTYGSSVRQEGFISLFASSLSWPSPGRPPEHYELGPPWGNP